MNWPAQGGCPPDNTRKHSIVTQGKHAFVARTGRYDLQPALGMYHFPLCRCTATPSAVPTATLRSTTPKTWSATTATARCHSAAICSATPSVAPTATLRSRMPTRCCATTKSAPCPSAAKRSARTTHALTTTFRCMALRTSSALLRGAPTTCAANLVSFARRRRGLDLLDLFEEYPDLKDIALYFCACYRHTPVAMLGKIMSFKSLIKWPCQTLMNLTALLIRLEMPDTGELIPWPGLQAITSTVLSRAITKLLNESFPRCHQYGTNLCSHFGLHVRTGTCMYLANLSRSRDQTRLPKHIHVAPFRKIAHESSSLQC